MYAYGTEPRKGKRQPPRSIRHDGRAVRKSERRKKHGIQRAHGNAPPYRKLDGKDGIPRIRRGKMEIEVENLDMVKEAVEAGADIIMLDNMTPEDMTKAIEIIDGRAETECSGNVTRENVDRLTKIGVDYISSGALTHSAPILDISLKNLHPVE